MTRIFETIKFRSVTESSLEISKEKIEKLLESEWQLYRSISPKSHVESKRASATMPLGVTSTFQHWDPYPLSITSAQGPWMFDVDGRRMLDLSMGFGAMLAGHLNPEVIKEVQEVLLKGTIFTSPAPDTRDAAEILARRFGVDQIRFANSGTEATMYAIRAARAFSGKHAVVKIEGGYHGAYDPLSVSVKPKISDAGDAFAPNAVHDSAIVPGVVYPVPFNNLEALADIFRNHAREIAGIVMEPVLENIGIVLPDDGYLEGVRNLCDEFGVLLIFDEVKTGLTAGPQGAAQRLKVQPDLICLAKSIGGGLPVAAFGGKKEVMATISDGRFMHMGTFNGNPLCMAGVRAMDRIATDEALYDAESLNRQALTRISDVISEYKLPAHTVGFGIKGCVTWSQNPVRNYREYKATNFRMAELSWLWSINRGIITPPGLDEQWLISLAHGQNEIDLLVTNFTELACALRSK
jgi:glutamate-1-semialdehyde 2,1-aminomutase